MTRVTAALAAAAVCLLAPAAARAKTLTFRFGPVSLNGYATEIGNDMTRAPRVDGFVTAMHAQLVDRAGRPVPQQRVMLHHVFFMTDGRAGHGDCSPAGSETFYGTGEEDQKIVLPRGYGYPVRKQDRWRVGWMFMNHRHSHARVYLQYRVTVDTSRALTPVTPYWISVSCAGSKIYSVPGGGAAGTTYAKARTWTVPETGRIVAGAAHAHGGALKVAASNACGELLASTARYGTADDPIYHLSPVLHEPAPRSMSVVTSRHGWPVRRGDRLEVVSTYSDEHPHSAVMGILHLYIAKGRGRTHRCPAQPHDVREHRLRFPGAPGRTQPPKVTPQLSTLDGYGVAQPLLGPLSGPLTTLAGNATVQVRNVAFSPRRLSVPAGAVVRWRFRDPIRHDVTLAAGPRAFASPYLERGSYRTKLAVPGEYRIFCSLHPVTMSQTIEVRPGG